MTHSLRLRAVVGAFALASGLGTLAACGSQSGTTAGDSKPTVSGGASKTAVSSPSPSTAGAAGQALPDGFPTGKVPLLGEKVLNGVKGSDGGPFAWSVVMTSTRAIADLSADVTKDFTDAGYQTAQATELGDVSIHKFTDDTYDVGVTIARTGDGVTITYLVKNK
jgi:hypothetical protein